MHTYWKDPEEMWGNDNVAEGRITARANSLCGRQREASQQGTLATDQSTDGIPIVQK